jgi:hypothetical protein
MSLMSLMSLMSNFRLYGLYRLYRLSPKVYFKNEVVTGVISNSDRINHLQKGGVPAAPSGTATLLRLSPSH